MQRRLLPPNWKHGAASFFKPSFGSLQMRLLGAFREVLIPTQSPFFVFRGAEKWQKRKTGSIGPDRGLRRWSSRRRDILLDSSPSYMDTGVRMHADTLAHSHTHAFHRQVHKHSKYAHWQKTSLNCVPKTAKEPPARGPGSPITTN